MYADMSSYSRDSKILNESGVLRNRVDSLNSNSCDSMNKVSVIRMELPTNNIVKQEFQKYTNFSQPVAKRGRPSAYEINLLRSQVPDSKYRYFCSNCVRGFKKKKGLNNHVRIHTNEKPFECTYPRCNDKFTQSSHLDTHIRLHTGEKPFCCPLEGCDQDYAHQSRKCKLHNLAVKRKVTKYGVKDIEDFNTKEIDEQEWLKQYYQNKENKVASFQKRDKANKTNSDVPRDETASSSQRIEQSEGDERIIQETNRAKRKRSDIIENINDDIQHISKSMNAENSSFATDEESCASDFSETEFLEGKKNIQETHVENVVPAGLDIEDSSSVTDESISSESESPDVVDAAQILVYLHNNYVKQMLKNFQRKE